MSRSRTDRATALNRSVGDRSPHVLPSEQVACRRSDSSMPATSKEGAHVLASSRGCVVVPESPGAASRGPCAAVEHAHVLASSRGCVVVPESPGAASRGPCAAMEHAHVLASSRGCVVVPESPGAACGGPCASRGLVCEGVDGLLSGRRDSENAMHAHQFKRSTNLFRQAAQFQIAVLRAQQTEAR